MKPVRLCDQCHAPLPGDAPEGICPPCLLRLGGIVLGVSLEAPSAECGIPNAGKECQNPENRENVARVVPWSGGSRFGNYEVLAKIGQGGMGAVYKARQLNLDRLVALKLLPPGAWSSADLVRRFRTEASAAAALQHPNIVAVHDVGEQDGQPFFSMDFVEGRTLAELVREQPLPAKRAAAYLKTIAAAMHYAHQQGVLHRDLKPSNILIDAADQPRITDFGLAKRLHGTTDLTLSGQVLGSPHFISPEQAEGRSQAVGPASDIYSLGALLYHLLTRQPPFQAETLTTLLQQVLEAEPIPPRSVNPSIPKDLETICLKCLEKEPARRYASARALEEDLGRFLLGEPIVARPVSAAAKAWKWCRRRPALAGVSAALVLTALAGLSAVFWQLQRARAGELLARRNAYADDMNRAQVAVENGDLGAAMSLLDAHRPARGDRDLRGWEWRYLWQRCRSDELFELTRSAIPLERLAFSPDGRWLAVGGEQSTLDFWDISFRQRVFSLRMWGYLNPFAFSRKGNLLAYAAAGIQAVSVVRLESRQEIARLLHTTNVAHLGFSGDARRLYTLTDDGALTGWDIASGQAVQRSRFPGPGYALNSRLLAFSPGRGVVAFGLENGLGLWELESGRQVRIGFTVADRSPTVLRFSPDGKLLAAGVGGADSEVRVWQVEELWQAAGTAPPPRGCYGKHRDWVCDVAFSPDSRALVSASADSALRVWELEHPETCRRYQGHRHQVLSVAWSPDGKHLVSSGKDGSVRVWNPWRKPAATGAREIPVVPLRYCFRLSPDGRTGIALDPTSQMAVLWDTERMRPIETLDFAGSNLVNLAWSPDGRTLAVAYYRHEARDAHTPDYVSSTIKIWDLASRRAVTNMMVTGYWVGYVQFLHDGRLLWCAAIRPGPPGDRLAKLWAVEGWREIRLPEEAATNASWAAFSPDARTMVVLHIGGALDLWDLPSGRCRGRGLHPFADPNNREGQVTFSPDGHTWATSTPSGVLCLWEVAGQLSPVIIPRSTQELWDITFTPDGARLLVSGRRSSDVVRLLDPGSHRFVTALSGKPDVYWFIRMTSDLSTIYAVGNERALIWRAPSWAEIEVAEKQRATR